MKPQFLNVANDHRSTGGHPGAAGHRDRWMISYVDVLTILLVFFIAAAAKTLPARADSPSAPAPQLMVEQPAKLDPAKLDPARLDPPKLDQPVRSPLADAEEKLAARGIDAHLESRGLMISLPQTILFASGDDVINSQAIPIVEEIAGVLGAVPNRVNLSGYADSTPIHNHRFKNNWELSAARGLRLLELLSGRYGISESRLTVSSDGANRPKESNETPEGRASNRRVEILILNEP
jgi:chemotaxis protein MotB